MMIVALQTDATRVITYRQPGKFSIDGDGNLTQGTLVEPLWIFRTTNSSFTPTRQEVHVAVRELPRPSERSDRQRWQSPV